MRPSTASLELLAPRADVWAFLAEPYHLSDRWPGIEIDPYERWAWHLLDPPTHVEARLQTVSPERTRVTVSTSRGRGQVPLRPRADGGGVVTAPTADRAPTIVPMSAGGGLVEWNPVDRFAGRRG